MKRYIRGGSAGVRFVRTVLMNTNRDAFSIKLECQQPHRKVLYGALCHVLILGFGEENRQAYFSRQIVDLYSQQPLL